MKVRGDSTLLLLLLFAIFASGLSTHESPSEPSTGDDSVAPVAEDNEMAESVGVPVALALVEDKSHTDEIEISPAEELRRAAALAGYNISDVTLQLAASGTDEELNENLPQPLAQALIDRRRLPDLRDRLIGMTFLGQPVPLGYRPRRRPFPVDDQRLDKNRRMDIMRKQIAADRRKNHFDIEEEIPGVDKILKPMSVSATRTGIIFPAMGDRYSQSRNPGPPVTFLDINDRKRPPRGPNFGEGSIVRGRPFKPSDEKPFRRGPNRFPRPPQSDKRKPQFFDLHEESSHYLGAGRKPFDKVRPPLKGNFNNFVSQDFGPVTYELESGDAQESPQTNFVTFDSSKIPPPDRPFRPGRNQQQRYPVTLRPSSVSNFEPSFSPSFNNFKNFGGFSASQSHTVSISLPRDPESQCTRYTETICLDADNYPHSEILASLEGDKGRTNELIAEVSDQSADDLVDGVSAREEQRYDFSHYFGGQSNRRQDTEEHRDFADDGGYLCPSEVMYARPKRAKNSKGEWKFVVNMDKYTQTVRMEKCIKPGGACSYVSHHYQAMCFQVHNYQRLLSWEKSRGLHMDIFKVPSCCTCHIQGYSFVFPPLSNSRQHSRGSDRKPGPPPKSRRPSPFEFGTPFSSDILNNEIRRMDVVEPRADIHTNRRSRPPVYQDSPNRRLDYTGPIRRYDHDGPPVGMSEDGTPIRRLDQVVESSMTFTEVVKPDRGPGKPMEEQNVNYDYHPIVQFFDG